MKKVLYGSIILLCVTLSVCAIVYTHRSRVVVTYKANTGYKEVNMDVRSSSVNNALDDVHDIDSLWDEKNLGRHYYQ